jgi:predicted HD superfamily hydrolase involved in NAD metabolism
MDKLLDRIQNNYTKTGNIFFDIENILTKYNKINVLNHSKEVTKKAIELSTRFGIDKYKIKMASYLHDISCIIPNENKISFSKYWKIEILDEEKLFPMIIHQKISKEMAKRIFEIKDNEILNSISCHTTLKASPTKMDMVLFISDKIKWDQKGEPPYIKLVEDSLNISLENGIKTYLNYLMENKEQLKVVHPWLLNAYEYFNRYE